MSSGADGKSVGAAGRQNDDALSDTTEQAEREVLESGTAPPSGLRSLKRSDRTRVALGDLQPRCISAALWRQASGEFLELLEVTEITETNKKEKIAPLHAQVSTELFKRLAAVSSVLDKLQRQDRDVAKNIQVKGSQLLAVQQEVESVCGLIAVFRDYDRMCNNADYLKTKDQLQIPSQSLRPEYARRFLRTGVQPECEAQAEAARKAREEILKTISQNYILVRKVQQAQQGLPDTTDELESPTEKPPASGSGKRGGKRR